MLIDNVYRVMLFVTYHCLYKLYNLDLHVVWRDLTVHAQVVQDIPG